MATDTVRPDYGPPGKEGFTTPLDEADRFSTERVLHNVPERRQSGNMPDQPEGLEVDPAPGNRSPVTYNR